MRKSVVLLSIALLFSVAASAWLWNELKAEREHSAKLASQLELNGREIAETPQDGASTQAAPAVPATSVSGLPAPDSAALVTTANVKGGGSQDDWLAYQRRLMTDPKYLEARRIQQRLRFAPRRANLVRLLGLTPEQADAAIDLDIDEEFFWESERNRQDGSDDARAAARARSEAFELQRQDKLRTLLGEEKRARLQGYMESRESRMQVEDLRSSLGEANALRDDQVEPLIAALHAERAQMKSDLQQYRDTLNWEAVNNESWRLWSERKIELTKAMNSRMLASASSTLTQLQLKALDEQLQRQVAQLDADFRLHKVQSKMNLPRTTER
jgi:hypothetical protein